ncbi:MAG: hypothetical protein ACREBU_15360, partial [Nitrososphaera sp.]
DFTVRYKGDLMMTDKFAKWIRKHGPQTEDSILSIASLNKVQVSDYPITWIELDGTKWGLWRREPDNDEDYWPTDEPS